MSLIRIIRLGLVASSAAMMMAACVLHRRPRPTLKRVAAFLKSLTARGFLSIKDPELAAEQLVASWFGMSVLRQSLGVAGPPSADAIAERVRYAVKRWCALGR